MVFRRRTDQIYATLQEVQRRITQGGTGQAPRPTGGASTVPAAGEAGSTAGGYVVHPDGRREVPRSQTRVSSSVIARQAAETRSRQQELPGVATGSAVPKVVIDEEPEPLRTAPPLPARPPAGDASARRLGPRGVVIGFEMACTMAAVWLASVVGAYLLGMGQNAAAPLPIAGTSTTAGTVIEAEENRGAAEDATWIVILDSVPADKVQAQLPKYQDKQKNYNAFFVRKGFREYFGTRTPQSGGLQFIYGMNNGRVGVSRSEAEAMHRAVTTPQPRAAGSTEPAAAIAPQARLLNLNNDSDG